MARVIGQEELHMSFVATDSTAESRSFAMGPLKWQLLTYTVGTGITSGTITCDRLSTVYHIFMDGNLAQTAAATFSGNVATIAFTDPAATVYGTILACGR